MAKKINWEQLEKDLEPNYSLIGRPSVPIRTIVGALAFEGNPFDGHTLKPQIEQVKEMDGQKKGRNFYPHQISVFFDSNMGLREYNNLQGQKKWVLIRIN